MSKFLDFYKKLQSDETTAKAFAKVAEEKKVAKGTSFADFTDDQLSALIPVAKGAGFDFSLDELKNFFKQSKDGEMSEDELEMVAGGKGETTPQQPEIPDIKIPAISKCDSGIGSIVW